jgi:hypothetical protein
MSPRPDSTMLRRQLQFWGGRGVACASLSFGLACTSGYSHPREIAGMVAAIATLILAMAWLTALRGYDAAIGSRRYGCSLRWAANLRAIWGVVGFALMMIDRLFPRMVESVAAVFMTPDLYAGMVAVVVTEAVGKVFHEDTSKAANSFCWTFLTALLQGGLVAASLAVLAGILTGLSWLIPKRAARNDVAEVS